ncbi:hypothetical protein HYQ44_020323 [Verticillium longisporum]|nr:hypothetical protein HYQ44_020323 [Verticillium longisporum]
MFDEFGIDLPEGWLSEDDDVAFAGDGTKSVINKIEEQHVRRVYQELRRKT